MKTIETQADLNEGIAALVKTDHRFERIIRVTGVPPLRRFEGGYRGLLKIVAGQQVSTASADAIWRRMETMLAPLETVDMQAHSDDELRAAGLSTPKMRTVRALTAAVAAGRLDFALLDDMDDDAVRAALTDIKGIGPWSAEMYLLSCLGRSDAWPAGDLALQNAAAGAFALSGRPDAAGLDALAEPWRPWRAVAARLIWAYYRERKSLSTDSAASV